MWTNNIGGTGTSIFITQWLKWYFRLLKTQELYYNRIVYNNQWLHNRWIEMNHQNISLKLQTLLNPEQNLSEEASLAKKLTKCTKNCKDSIQHWSFEKDLFFFMTTPNHSAEIEKTRLWNCFTQLTHHSSLWPAITFLRGLWCSSYHHRKSTWWQEFKSWTRLLAFPMV